MVRPDDFMYVQLQASGRASGRVHYISHGFPVVLSGPEDPNIEWRGNTRVYNVCTATTTMSSEAAQLVTDIQSLSVSGTFDKSELYLTCGSLMTRRRRSLAAPSLLPD